VGVDDDVLTRTSLVDVAIFSGDERIDPLITMQVVISLVEAD
jgi:hypothetical protein